MARLPDAHKRLSATLTLSELKDGFWLYDTTQGMNLAMRAKTQESAFVEAITYYQKRLAEIQSKHKDLSEKVDAFVSHFVEEQESEF